MIYLDRVLSLPSLLSNICNGMVFGVFSVESSVLGNDSPWVLVSIINHHYDGYFSRSS